MRGNDLNAMANSDMTAIGRNRSLYALKPWPELAPDRASQRRGRDGRDRRGTRAARVTCAFCGWGTSPPQRVRPGETEQLRARVESARPTSPGRLHRAVLDEDTGVDEVAQA